MTDDLVPRLLALARAEHDDLSVAEEAAHELQAERETAGDWKVVAELAEAAMQEWKAAATTLQAAGVRLQIRFYAALNVRRSDDQVGLVCATCGDPVESAPCPEHSPVSRA